MSGADDAKGTSGPVAADWEAAVDCAIRIHERVYRRLATLHRMAVTDRERVEWTTSKARDAERALWVRAI